MTVLQLALKTTAFIFGMTKPISLQEILVLACFAGAIKWRSEEMFCNRIGNIMWSPGGKFVAFGLPWINDTDAIVVDTFDSTHFHLLGLSSVIDAISYAVGSEIRHSSYNEFRHSIVRWIDASTLEVRFYCLTVDGRVIEGIYRYDVATGEVKIVTILGNAS